MRWQGWSLSSQRSTRGRGGGHRREVFGDGAALSQLKDGADLFGGEAETTRHADICVPLYLYFPFPLPGGSVDLKVLMKPVCLQKRLLSWACYLKCSTEIAESSAANSSPSQK